MAVKYLCVKRHLRQRVRFEAESAADGEVPVSEAREAFNLGESTVTRWISRGKLAGRMQCGGASGRRYVVPLAAVAELARKYHERAARIDALRREGASVPRRRAGPQPEAARPTGVAAADRVEYVAGVAVTPADAARLLERRRAFDERMEATR